MKPSSARILNWANQLSVTFSMSQLLMYSERKCSYLHNGGVILNFDFIIWQHMKNSTFHTNITVLTIMQTFKWDPWSGIHVSGLLLALDWNCVDHFWWFWVHDPSLRLGDITIQVLVLSYSFDRTWNQQHSGSSMHFWSNFFIRHFSVFMPSC